MGRGKKWSSEERERVAIAWTRATHDPVVGRNQSGETFDEKVYSLFSRKPPKDADPGTYSERSHPSVMTCFRNNISPDVMKFIGVLRMVKGVGLSGVNAEQLIRISVAVYLLKRKGEALPKSNSAFYLLKEADPDNWVIQFPPEMDENWVRYGLAKLGQISRTKLADDAVLCVHNTASALNR